MHPGIYASVMKWIPEGSRVLDLGTGDGAFLDRLVRDKRIVAEGVEKNPALVSLCIQRGLVVHQGNIMEGLDQYSDQSFDYVTLLGTFQELLMPEEIVREAVRVGKRVIVSYNNFAYYRVRLQILFCGHTPITPSLPQPWYRTANLHFLSTLDFHEFCRALGVSETRRACFGTHGAAAFWPNLLAAVVVSLLESQKKPR